jgi:hypothetical protein
LDLAQHTEIDVARGYQVESDLTRLIEKRHDERVKTEGERAEHELWAESERRYFEVKRRQNVAAWFAFFCRQAEAHRKLSESYEARAEKLCEEDRGEGASVGREM